MALFFILYGMTGVAPLIAAIYLLLRQGNAFAPDVTPPLALRRWAASFFAASALGHVWWYLFYVYSNDIHSVSYAVVGVIDTFGMLTTIAGTLFAMLQDRKRPVWPLFAALPPYVVTCVLFVVYDHDYLLYLAIGYILLLYAVFTVYMVFAVRRYGRWLNDNYADLENKKVWLSQVVALVCLLLFILYTLVNSDSVLLYILHFIELVLFSLLLWRVETLPELPSAPVPAKEKIPINIDLAQIEQLLEERCAAKQLYLKYDLSLQQLAQALGTNRSYLSHYFSRQGITYNTYINNLRINYFISRYQEVASAQLSFTVQQLAYESGYRSYSTFSLAFKQRTGQSVTAWMHQTTE